MESIILIERPPICLFLLTFFMKEKTATAGFREDAHRDQPEIKLTKTQTSRGRGCKRSEYLEGKHQYGDHQEPYNTTSEERLHQRLSGWTLRVCVCVGECACVCGGIQDRMWTAVLNQLLGPNITSCSVLEKQQFVERGSLFSVC